jgi:DHA1 family chloramphenicol resistance protein-like MFS transporter
MTAHAVARPGLSDNGRVWLLAGTCASSFLSLLIGLALGPFLPEIARDLDAPVALLGQVPALIAAGAAGLGFVAGPLADHYGLRRALLVGLAAGAVLAVGTSLATTVLVLLVVGVFGAVSRAVVSPVATALSGAHFEGEWLRRAVGIQLSATSGAAILGVPLLTGAAYFVGWRGAFLALAVLVGLVALLVPRVVPADRAAPAARPRVGAFAAAYRLLLADRATVLLIGTSLASSVYTWALTTYFGAFYAERHGLGTQTIGLLYMSTGAAVFLVSTLVGTPLLRGLPLGPALVATGPLQALALALPEIAPVGLTPALALHVVGYGLIGVRGTATSTLLLGSSRAGRATTMTINNAAFSVGTAVGSSLGGLALALGGYGLLGWTLLPFGLAAAALAALSLRARREPS